MPLKSAVVGDAPKPVGVRLDYFGESLPDVGGHVVAEARREVIEDRDGVTGSPAGVQTKCSRSSQNQRECDPGPLRTR